MNTMVLTDMRAYPHCLVANKPRRNQPVPVAVPAMPALAAKRPPLRALPYAALSHHFWSQGKPFYADNERRRARALLKPLAAQSLDEMVGGSAERVVAALSKKRGILNLNYGEVLAESRQSFLSFGQGVLSLEALPQAGGEEAIGTIAEAIADDHPLRQIEAIANGDDPETECREPRVTPYTVVDPITAKQIAWEKRVAQDGPVHRMRWTTSAATGKLTLTVSPKFPSQEAFVKAATNMKRWLIASVGQVSSLDDLQTRLSLLAEGHRVNPGPTIDFDYEAVKSDIDARRANEFADREWHSAYEIAVPVVAILDDDAMVPACGRWTCNVTDKHVHERHTRLVHRSALRSKDEFWQQRLPDVTAYEIGTEGLVEPLVTDPVAF